MKNKIIIGVTCVLVVGIGLATYSAHRRNKAKNITNDEEFQNLIKKIDSAA